MALLVTLDEGQAPEAHYYMDHITRQDQTRKRPNQTEAPFYYCGQLDFQSWERPITVEWRLRAPLSGEWARLLNK